MKLNEVAFANAFGVVGAIFSIVCTIIVLIAPGLYESIVQSWMHLLNLSGLWKAAPEGFVLGFISYTLVCWITGLLIAKFYNSFAKK